MHSFYISEYNTRKLRHIQILLNHLQPEVTPGALIVPGSPQPRNNVIVFPASFNPPTSAHMALLKRARHFMNGQGSDWLLYAAFSRLTVGKEEVERPLLLDRVALLRLLLRRRLPRAGILLTNRGLYVEQAEDIRRAFPTVRRLLFLMGYDKIVQIFDARYYTDRDVALRELFHQAELLVAPRGSAGIEELEALLQQPQNRTFARYVHALPFSATYRDVSSTLVRQGQSVADAPQEVRQFMRMTRAYAPPLKQIDGSVTDCYAQRISYLRSRGIPV